MEFGENKTMMGVVIALLVLFAVAVFFYNKTLNELAAGSCTDAGNGCPHEKILETQNVIIAALILVIGILAAWIFVQIGKNPEEKKAEEGKPARAPQRKVNLSELDTDEKRIVSLLQERQGSVFQSDVIKLTGFSKVKVSRILDKMENSGLIERKRRGMTNLVVLR